VSIVLFAAPLLVAACAATSDNEFDAGSTQGAGPGGATGAGGSILDPDASTGSSFGDANCGASTYANAVPASILVVLDRSGSMSGGDGVPDKWGPAVSAMNAMMAGASPDLGVGLLPFPAGNFDSSGLALCLFSPSPQCDALFADGGCMDVDPTPVVAVGPLSTTQAPISSWLAANGPNGGTPTLHALKTAYTIMRDLPVDGERFVLLMTDGEPNVHLQAMGPLPESNIECGQLSNIEAEALNASSGSPSVKTFVIGSPGSEPAGQFLSQVALNGLTPKSPDCNPAAKDCHYQIGQANYQTDLQAALDKITGTISDCIFEIPQGTDMVDPDKVNVVVETSGGTIETYKDPAHQDGWDYTDPSHTTVQLYGPACEAYKAEKGSKVSILLGCETVVK
jgi:hypothetical protein